MVARLYFAPIETVFAGTVREGNGSRVLLYTPPGTNTAHIMPNPYKNWCLSWVDTTLERHLDIEADSLIQPLPLRDNGAGEVGLDEIYGAVTLPRRNLIHTTMEGRRIPADWLTPAHTVRHLVRHMIRHLHCVQMLKTDYPEGDLNDTFQGATTIFQRTNIHAWMDANGIEHRDLLNAVPLRRVLREMVTRYPWQGEHRLGRWTI